VVKILNRNEESATDQSAEIPAEIQNVVDRGVVILEENALNVSELIVSAATENATSDVSHANTMTRLLDATR
jgi:hypothetical protein